jgi:hypothetical protein
MTNPMEEITRCEGCPHEDDGLACPPGNFCRAELEDQIAKVRELRALHDSMKEGIDKKRSVWEKENEKILTSEAACRKTLVGEEARLRELTLEAYEATGSKKPADGVGIRIVRQLHYDEAEALVWAIESGVESCLSLQKANFNKAAEGLKLDFVKIEEIPQATIAREL